MHCLKIVLPMLALLLNACGTPSKFPSPERLNEGGYAEIGRWLDRDVPGRIKRNGITGIAIALVDGSDIVAQRNYGFADKASGRKVTADTLFRAGSVTKSFTSLGVMQMVEQGRLALDAPLREAIPDFRIQSHNGNDDGVTLRRVLSHHAALPSDMIAGMWAEQPEPFTQVVNLLKDQYLTSEPGTAFSYSNVGYSLAGHALQLASGEPYTRYIEQQILEPLQMHSSSFDLGADPENLSLGYKKGKAVTEFDIRDKPAGALITTAADLAQFVKAVIADGDSGERDIGKRLLQAETIKTMLTPPIYNSPFSVSNPVALGWFRVPAVLPMGDDMVMHNGQTMAHSALIQIGMQSKLGVVILSNSPVPAKLDEIARDLFDLAYKVKFPQTAKVAATPRAVIPGKPVTGVGQYVSEFGLIKVKGSDKRLQASAAGERWSLRGNARDGYQIKLKLFGILPIANDDLRAARVHFREVEGHKIAYIEQKGVLQIIASALQPQQPSAAWLARTGEYELVSQLPGGVSSLDIGPMELLLDSGNYVLRATQGDQDIDYALRFISDDKAVVQGYGRNMGATVRVFDDGRVEWLGLQYRLVVSE